MTNGAAQTANGRRTFQFYGWIGLAVMLIAEFLLIQGNAFIKRWFTPIMWSGYILFLDALILKWRGDSLLHDRFKQFLFMLPYSIGCWLIFEAYNLHLQNWQYIGLPGNLAVRYFAYAWAFATIFPGVLLTYELIKLTGIFDKITLNTFRFRRGTLVGMMVVGMLFLVVPVLVPQRVAVYLFGPVWLGFIFVLDPLNYFIGGKSLFRDLENGRLNKTLALLLVGLVCGLLWEFWNYWASSKWKYTFPYLTEPKIFEMPLIGYLGFLPFAIEIYVMWQFAVRILKFDDN